ncbi:hypothetical protein Bxe_B0046 [Paraburkholderia xenovorans LB400]|uniref:Uncharacterized protein n=2 Tax=Paraburkholderia xenovorans TaxID=36873 RepID=Q13J59_PARXL|nr:hypothetical protein Bxe_B0046 [Paraburkholderia xenovorans LB400]
MRRLTIETRCCPLARHRARLDVLRQTRSGSIRGFTRMDLNIPREILSEEERQRHHIRRIAELAVARMRQRALSILQKEMKSGKSIEEI